MVKHVRKSKRRHLLKNTEGVYAGSNKLAGHKLACMQDVPIKIRRR